MDFVLFVKYFSIIQLVRKEITTKHTTYPFSGVQGGQPRQRQSQSVRRQRQDRGPSARVEDGGQDGRQEPQLHASGGQQEGTSIVTATEKYIS